MQSAISIALVSLVIVISGCAGKRTQSQPDWINGNSADYPNAHYLAGRGQSDNAAIARDRARADLAKVFQVSINEHSEDTIKHTRQGSGNTTLTTLDAETKRKIVSRTEQTLTDVVIAEIWQHPTSKQFHALAVLDRLKSATSLRGEIQQLDQMVTKSIIQAKQQTDLLDQIGAASRAVKHQLMRQSMQRQLKVVDPSGVGVSSKQNLATLIEDRNGLLERLRIDSTISSDPLGGLEAIINGAIAHAGFKNDSRQPNYRLSAQLSLSDFRDNRGWFWYRGTLLVGLNELPSNRNRGTYRWQVKAAAQQQAVAARRVLNDLDGQLKNELRDIIIGFAEPD